MNGHIIRRKLIQITRWCCHTTSRIITIYASSFVQFGHRGQKQLQNICHNVRIWRLFISHDLFIRTAIWVKINLLIQDLMNAACTGLKARLQRNMHRIEHSNKSASKRCPLVFYVGFYPPTQTPKIMKSKSTIVRETSIKNYCTVWKTLRII